jgi:hypothetical protein
MSETDYTWYVGLDELDAALATFKSDNHGNVLKLDRDDWIKLGRPAQVSISPKAVS